MKEDIEIKMKEDNKQVINYLREDVAFNRRHLLKAALAGLMGVSLQSKAATVWQPIGAGSADALSSNPNAINITPGTIVTGVTTQQGMYVYNGFRYREGAKNFFSSTYLTAAVGQNGLLYTTNNNNVILLGGTGYLDDTNKITTFALFSTGYKTFYAIGSNGLLYICNNSNTNCTKKLFLSGYLENTMKAAFIFACYGGVVAVGTNGLLYKLSVNTELTDSGTYVIATTTTTASPTWVKINNTGLLGADYVKDVILLKGTGNSVFAVYLSVTNQLYFNTLNINGAASVPYLVTIPSGCGNSIVAFYGNSYTPSSYSSSIFAITDNGSILVIAVSVGIDYVFHPPFSGYSTTNLDGNNFYFYYPTSPTEVTSFLNGAVVSSVSGAKWLFPKIANITPILVSDDNKIFYSNMLTAQYSSPSNLKLRDSNFAATPTFVKYFLEEKGYVSSTTSAGSINIYAIGSDGLLYVSSVFSAGDAKNITFTKFNNTGYLYATVKCVDVFTFSNAVPSVGYNNNNIFFLGEDGRLYCIGDNYTGTLGIGNTTPQTAITLFNGNGLMDNLTYLKVS